MRALKNAFTLSVFYLLRHENLIDEKAKTPERAQYRISVKVLIDRIIT